MSGVPGEGNDVSYARFGWDGSDVYVYADTSGGITCAACALGGPVVEDASSVIGIRFPPSWTTPTKGPGFDPHYPDRDVPSACYGEMIVHLSSHVDAGDHVPDDAFDRLTREMNAALDAERATGTAE